MHLCLGLVVVGLNILGNGVSVNGALGDSDMRLGVGVELLALVKVEVDGVGPGNREEDEGNAHGLSGANTVGDVTKDDRTHGTTADGGNDEGGTTLGVATESTKSEGEN